MRKKHQATNRLTSMMVGVIGQTHQRYREPSNGHAGGGPRPPADAEWRARMTLGDAGRVSADGGSRSRGDGATGCSAAMLLTDCFQRGWWRTTEALCQTATRTGMLSRHSAQQLLPAREDECDRGWPLKSCAAGTQFAGHAAAAEDGIFTCDNGGFGW